MLPTRPEPSPVLALGHARHRPLSRAEEQRLFAAMHAGDERARQRLLEANVRFVTTIAARYVTSSLSYEELVSEGTIGLCIAVDRFDPARGMKFITYAVWWIRQRILAAVVPDQSIVRAPTNRQQDLMVIERHAKALAQDLQREPTDEEIMGTMECADRRYRDAVALRRRDRSLDVSIAEDGPTRLESVPATDEPGDDRVARLELEDWVDERLDELDARSRLIIRWYYGLDGDRASTLEQIGDRLGITRERVRQLRDAALRILRDHTPEEMAACQEA